MSYKQNIKLLVGLDYLDRKYKTGLDRYCEEMVKWFTENLNTLDIFSYSDYEDTALNNNEAVTLHSLNTTRRKYIFKNLIRKTYPEIEEIINITSPEIVHLLIPMAFNLKLKIPLVITVHDLTPFITPEAFPKYTPLIIRKTIHQLIKNNAYFITNSVNTKNDLIKFFAVPEERVFPVYLGIGPQFKPTSATDNNEIKLKYNLPEQYFLYIGSMNKRKNLLTIINSFKLFQSHQKSDIKLVLAGRMDWGGKEITQYVKENNLTNVVCFPGYIHEADLNTIINSSLALLYLSLYEGFGFPVLEAMACGTVVIASNNSSIPEISNNIAYMANPKSEQEICDRMIEASTNQQLRSKKIEEGISWAKNFTWQKTGLETIKAYNRIKNIF